MPVATGVPTLGAHQEAALAWHRRLRYSANISPTGTGKSLPAACRLSDLVPPHRALLIAPQQVLGTPERPGAWPRLFHRLRPDWKLQWLTGERHKRHKAIMAPHHIGMINPEGLAVLGTELVDVGRYGVILGDEVHRSRNPASTTSRIWGALAAEAEYVIGLSGSPLLESPVDLFGIFRAIYPQMFGDDFYAWRGRYFEMRSDPDEDGYHAYPRWCPREGTMAILGSAIRSISYYCSYEDLPWKDFPTGIDAPPVYVDLPEPVRGVYEDIKEEVSRGLTDGLFTSENIRPRLLKMLQLTSGWMYDNDHNALPVGECTKAAALASLVDEFKGEPFVVWAVHPPDMTLAARAIDRFRGKVRYGIVYGDTPQGERQDILNAFNSGKINGLIAHPTCLGEAVDLEEAHDVRMTRTWSANQWHQSRGRGRRASSRHDRVIYYEILARDTIDEGIRHSLRGKVSYLSLLLKHAGFAGADGEAEKVDADDVS